MTFLKVFTVTFTIWWTVEKLHSQECGVPVGNGKIVGGVDTGGYHYPWFAVILLNSKTNLPNPICGGSLISSNIVLSAAHCFASLFLPNVDMFTVALGVYDMCDEKESTREYFNIKDIIIHEKYNRRGKFYDIALVKLEKHANYGVICLPLAGVPDKTEKALLIGFGVTSEISNGTPCTMLEANVTKFSRQDCANTKLPMEDKNEPSIICAGMLSGSADSCYGDSGGPLQVKNSNGRYVIEGIVSYGYGCGTPQVPGVYTNVGSYLQWINDKISGSVSSTPQETNIRNNINSFNRKRVGVFRRDHKTVKFPNSENHNNSQQNFRATPRNTEIKEGNDENTTNNTKIDNVKKKSHVTFPKL